MLVEPTTTSPAAASFCRTVASYGARKPARIFEPQVVSKARLAKMSFTATGRPCSRERAFPAHLEERTEPAVEALDARERRGHDLPARHVAALHVEGELRESGLPDL